MEDLESVGDRIALAMEKQTAAIVDLSVAIRTQRRTSRLIMALVILNVIGVTGAGISVYGQNQAAVERSKTAQDQRTTQLQILREIQAQQK